MHKKILFGISASWFRLLTLTVIGLLLTPLLFKYLPAEELGVWYLLYTIATFISLSDLGIPTAFSRAVSYRLGSRQSGASSDTSHDSEFYQGLSFYELYSAALAASLFTGGTVALVGYPLAHIYLSHVISSPVLENKITITLAVFMLGVVVNLISAIPYACLTGHGDVGIDNGTRTILQVAGFCATVYVLPLFRDIRALSYIYVFQGALLFLTGHYLLYRRYGFPIGFSWKIHLPAVRRLYAEALPVFITRIGLWMIIESNLLIAGYFLSAALIPDFAILRQLVMTGMIIPTSIPLAIMPHASSAYAAGDTAKVRRLYLSSVRYSLILTSVWTVGLLIWTPDVMDIWLGKGHFLGYAVLVPVVINCFLELHASAHGFFTWSAGKWPFAPLMIIAGLLNVILAGAGCWIFSLIGLAWGTLLSQALTGYWYTVFYTLRLLKVAAREYLKDILRPILIYIAVLLLGAGALAIYGIPFLDPLIASVVPSSAFLVIRTGAGIIMTVLAAVLLAPSIALRRQDREDLASLFRSWVRIERSARHP